MNRKKIQFIGGGIIIFGAIAYLSITGMQQGMSYYHEVNEVQARAIDLYGKGLRVSGKVQQGSIRKTADQRVYNFQVTDGKASLPIHFEGIVPDLFKEGAEVIVEGKFRRDGVLVASNVMTACPPSIRRKPTRERHPVARWTDPPRLSELFSHG
ncbi:MAG: cytochrome c maturation protein CcmE [Nitrospinota bacterium]